MGTETARRLRVEQTDAERLLWAHLRNRRLEGWKFCRQKPFGPFVLDFFCHEARLAVELDGGQHAESATSEADALRTAWLAGQNISVIRFWNRDVLLRLRAVLETIYAAVVQQCPHPTLSQRERGQKLAVVQQFPHPTLSQRERGQNLAVVQQCPHPTLSQRERGQNLAVVQQCPHPT